MKRPPFDESLKPSPEERAHQARMRKSLARGSLVGLAIAGLIIGWGVLTYTPPAESRCSAAADSHLEQAELARDPDERRAHAELARAYQVADSVGEDCSWWEP